MATTPAKPLKYFINRPEDIVTEALEGLIATTPHLSRLDTFPGIKVLFDNRHDKNKHVSIISGGGSGHEPAFCGMIGAGLLTAAIAGDVFAAPPEEAVLAAILHTTGPPGCLIIVNNYTGDRLVFGAAVERAKAMGIQIDLVINGDDCALPIGQSAIGRRGLAGGILAMKAAGSAANAGYDLPRITALAQSICDSLGTMGCCLTCATLPGQPASAKDRLGDDEMGMGLGLHGEPGAYTAKVRPVDGIVNELVSRIAGESEGTTYLHFNKGDSVVIYVNNLGAATGLEMGVIARAVIQAVQGHQLLQGVKIERLWVGAAMTSLEMRGFSLSLLKLSPSSATTTTTTTTTQEILELLDVPTDAPGWPSQGGNIANVDPHKKIVKYTPPEQTHTTGSDIDSAGKEDGKQEQQQGREMDAATKQTLRACIQAACQSLIDSESLLNELDGRVGDGDCGTTAAIGARALLTSTDALLSSPSNSPSRIALSIAEVLGKNIGGTSGAILKIFFSAAGVGLQQQQQQQQAVLQFFSEHEAAIAMKAGIAAVTKYGGAHPGDRTMVDALVPAAEALERAAGSGTAAEAAAAAAQAGAESTKDMLARAGRSTYVSEELQKGVRDPGAVAVGIWLGAVAQALSSSGGGSA